MFTRLSADYHAHQSAGICFVFFWGGGFKTTLDERNVDAYLVSCSVFGPQIGEVVVSR